MMRLRQIALVTDDLRGVEQQVCDRLGLEVCYRDPGLSFFGLRHGLYAIGDQLLEVVAPARPNTTAARFLERRSGDGGYMVLLQTDDLQHHRARVEAAGIRIVHDGGLNERETSIHGLHLHPKDVGGAILSLDQADPPASWLWAGHDWEYHVIGDVVTSLVAIEIQADDPPAMAERWAGAVGLPANDVVIQLDDAQIRFVPATDGRGDGLAAADLVATDRTRAGETIEIGGFGFNLV